MKKLIYIVSACLCMTSCAATSYFQICEVGSQLPQISGGHYVYQDEACSVFYDFWSRGGNPGFEFTNNTDEIIYVDLSKSFFIKNGEAHDYYLNRTVATSSSYATSASASKTGTVQGYWTTGYGYGVSAPGSASKAVAVSESSSRSTEVRIEEKPIVASPPHTSKYFTEYSVCSKYFYNCEYYITPRIKNHSYYTFQSTNTPISFGNYITYRLGDNPEEYSFTNEFYISSVGYYREKAVTEYVNVGCENEPQQKQKVFNCVSPDKFYIKYDR